VRDEPRRRFAGSVVWTWVAQWLNTFGAAAGAIAGTSLLRQAGVRLAGSVARAQFAAGNVVAAAGLTLLLSAALFSVAAFVCVWLRRRLVRLAERGAWETVLLLGASAPPLLALGLLAWLVAGAGP